MNGSVLFSLRLSLQVALIATFFVIIVGVCIAYLLARKDFKGRELIDSLVTLPLVLPPTVTGYYLIILFGKSGFIGKHLFAWTGWNIMFTWYAAVLASFVVALPLMIKTARAAIESVDKNLINTSCTLGRSEVETVFKVILPLSGKGLVAGAVLSFARAMGEFGATLMLAGNIPGRTDTMPLAIYTLANSGDRSGAHIMVLIFTVISGLFLYISNRFAMRTV
ncbi:MAG: molybdate ABC transporter permease subunit [Nitrospirota bacterium]|nr:molybdate ABC transporter permease subunit [Nitrospirota bacterium]